MAEPKVSFTITAQDLATPVLSRVNAGLRGTASDTARVGGMFGGPGREGVRKFENALTNLALAQVGVRGTMGKLIEGLAIMGVGGGILAAVAGGVALLGGAYRALTSDGENLRKKNEDITNGLVEQAAAMRAATLEGTKATLAIAEASLHAELAKVGQHSSLIRDAGPLVGGIISRITGDAGRASRIAELREARDFAEQQYFNAGSLRRETTIYANGSPEQRRAHNRIMELVRRALFDLGVQTSGDIIKPAVGIRTGPVPDLSESPSGVPKFFTDAQERILSQIEDEFAPNLTGAVQNAFARAFSGEGLGGLIKGFGQVILAQLGDLFIRMGSALIGFGKIMSGIQKALMNVLTSGPAAVIGGVALIALGAGLNAIASGGSGGPRGFSGSSRGFSSPGGFNGGGFSSGLDVFGRGGRPTTTVIVQGGTNLDFKDHETRDQFAAAGIEVQIGTRQTVQVGHVRRV
jgi:hypothetical protein